MPLRTFKPQQRHDHTLWRFAVALVVAGVLLLISGASVKAAWEMYRTFDIAAAERTGTEAELAALKEEYKTMTVTLENFSSGRGFEEAVRERFGFVRPGEGEIRIVRAAGAEEVPEEVNTNPFSRLFNALFW